MPRCSCENGIQERRTSSCPLGDFECEMSSWVSDIKLPLLALVAVKSRKQTYPWGKMFYIISHQACTLSGCVFVWPKKLLLPDFGRNLRFFWYERGIRVGQSTIFCFHHLGHVMLFGHMWKPVRAHRTKHFWRVVDSILRTNRVVSTMGPLVSV